MRIYSHACRTLAFLLLCSVLDAVKCREVYKISQNHFSFVWRPTAYLLSGLSRKEDGFDAEFNIMETEQDLMSSFEYYRGYVLRGRYYITSEVGPIPTDSIDVIHDKSTKFTIYCYGELLFREIRICFNVNKEQKLVNGECRERSTCANNVIVPNDLGAKISCNVAGRGCFVDDQVTTWLEAAKFDGVKLWPKFYIDMFKTRLDRIENATDSRSRNEARLSALEAKLNKVELELGKNRSQIICKATIEPSQSRKASIESYVRLVASAIIVALAIVAFSIHMYTYKARYRARAVDAPSLMS